MKERNKKTLTKILSHINKVQNYMNEVKSFDEFDMDSLKKDAVVFNLMQIGELSNKKLTNDFKKNHESIPWIKIYGLRNRIVHDYDNIHSKLVYQTITYDLIELASEIKGLIE
ncbi:MAG: HepT-like ribonuclease domain-containing protein [Bacillota bacterium]